MAPARNLREASRLTVAMITRDAAPLIADSLASVASIADEMIVVETGSCAESMEIARAAGAKVVDHPWSDDFSAARNAAIAKATRDWILWLDAGEQLAAESAGDLRAFLDGAADVKHAYQLQIEIAPLVPHAAHEQIARVRLMPRAPGLAYVGRVLEQVEPSLSAAGVSVEWSPWRIERGTREHDPDVKADRAARNLKLLKLEIDAHGPQPGYLVAMGEAHAARGESREAVAQYRRALESAPRGSVAMLEAYYGLLAVEGEADDSQEKMTICLAALDVFPNDAQLLCAMGNYLQAQNRLDLACRSFQAASEVGRVTPEVWRLADIHVLAAVCLGAALQLQGDDDRARQALEDALQRHGESASLRRHLLDLHVKHGRTDEALAELKYLPTDAPHREALKSAVRGACQAAVANWPPALAYLKTAYGDGCRDPFCLKWFCVALVSTGALEAAEQLLVEWQTLEPANSEVRQYLAAVRARRASDAAADLAASETRDDGRRLRVDRATAAQAPNRGAAKPSSIARTGLEPPAGV